MEKQVNNPYLEPAFSRYLHGKAARNGIPLAGNFELTPCCDLRCKMCYVRKTPEEVRAMGGLRSMEDWIRLGEEAVEKGMLFLLITGGEPMTHPGFFEIYKTLHRKGVMISVNTTERSLTKRRWSFSKRIRLSESILRFTGRVRKPTRPCAVTEMPTIGLPGPLRSFARPESP